MPKTASLSPGLVKKGEAAPTPPAAARTLVAADDVAGGTGCYYKALTVKLTKERYTNLKTAGVRLDKKSQEILVEALDAWLQINK